MAPIIEVPFLDIPQHTTYWKNRAEQLRQILSSMLFYFEFRCLLNMHKDLPRTIRTAVRFHLFHSLCSLWFVLWFLLYVFDVPGILSSIAQYYKEFQVEPAQSTDPVSFVV